MIGPNKERVFLTFDKDVLARARAYAQNITLSSMINRMVADALGLQPPPELKAKLPKLPGCEPEEEE